MPTYLRTFATALLRGKCAWQLSPEREKDTRLCVQYTTYYRLSKATTRAIDHGLRRSIQPSSFAFFPQSVKKVATAWLAKELQVERKWKRVGGGDADKCGQRRRPSAAAEQSRPKRRRNLHSAESSARSLHFMLQSDCGGVINSPFLSIRLSAHSPSITLPRETSSPSTGGM